MIGAATIGSPIYASPGPRTLPGWCWRPTRTTARAYARVLQKVTGHKPVVVLSDDPRSSAKIAAFAKSEERWLVAVRQVSEGVDIPRARGLRVDDVVPHPAVLRPGRGPRRACAHPARDRDRVPARGAPAARAGRRRGDAARPCPEDQDRRSRRAGRVDHRAAGRPNAGSTRSSPRSKRKQSSRTSCTAAGRSLPTWRRRTRTTSACPAC